MPENTQTLKDLLIQRGITQISIARELGVRRGSVCTVVNGIDASERIVQAIADKLGMPADQVKKLIPDYRAA